MAINQDYESVTEPSRALGLFTDRKKETRHFLTYLNSDPTPEKVLFFWGEGGNGKSLFLEYLRKYFCKVTQSIEDWNELSSLSNEEIVSYFKFMEEKYKPVQQAFLDFGIYLETYRPKDSIHALMQLRRDLSGCGISFPIFDFGAALYLHKTDRLENQRDLFPKEIVDLGTELAVALLEHTPGIKIVKSLLNVINKHYGKSVLLSIKESKGAKVDEEIVLKLHSFDAEKELVYMLPKLFATDLNNSMEKSNSPKRVVLFFDTHEAFWGARERHLADHHLFERDEWLRKFIGLLDLHKGIIVVLAGRERPKWSTPKINHRIPEQNIDTQLIGHFSETDAKDYLKKTGITDLPLQYSLIELAKVEKEQIHPFYLGLCVDIILQANLNGIKLTDEDINQWLKNEAGDKEQELIKRFLKYVDTVDLVDCIKAVSLCRSFDFELYFELGKKLNLVVSEPLFKKLINFSFIKELEIRTNNYEGTIVYRIHDLLRRVINEQNNDFVMRAHKIIESYYREKVKEGDLIALGEAIYHKTQINWKEGATEWCEKFDEALKQTNFPLCIILKNLCFDFKIEDDGYLAKFAYYQGKYFSNILRHEDAIKELEFSIQKNDILLSVDSNNAIILNNKGQSLKSLGDQHANLSQQQEEKESYSQAIAAYDKAISLAPDYSYAHNNKGNALKSLGDLQASLSKHQEATQTYLQSVMAYDRALSFDPNFINAHSNKGLTLKRLGDLQAGLLLQREATESYSQSIEAYDEALSLAPDYINAHNNKGLTLTRWGDLQAGLLSQQEATDCYSRAILAYGKALELAPDYIYARINMGDALGKLGDLQAKPQAKKSYSRAIAAFDCALRIIPNHNYVLRQKENVIQKQSI